MSRGLCWCCHMRFADFSLRMILDICSAKPPLKHMVHPCQLPAPYLQTACTLRSRGMNPTIAMQDLAHIKSQTKFQVQIPFDMDIYIIHAAELPLSGMDILIALSCQPLLGVSLSPEFVNLYFPYACLLYTSPSPRDRHASRMPSSA